MNYTVISPVIPSGQTTHTEVNLDLYGDRYVRRVAVQSPATLPEAVTISVSLNGTTFATLQSGGSDITFPAGKVTQINGCMAAKFQLVAGGAVAADRTFLVSISIE